MPSRTPDEYRALSDSARESVTRSDTPEQVVETTLSLLLDLGADILEALQRR